jgi:hypothetical protein
MKELLVVLALCGYQIFPIADIISSQILSAYKMIMIAKR